MNNKLDKLDVDTLVPVPIDLSKLINEVKYGVIKKDVHNAKIKNIEDGIFGITSLGAKTTLNAKIIEVKAKIPHINHLATNISLHAEINEIKCKIPNITNLVATSSLTAV